jgi:hypothetical protein
VVFIRDRPILSRQPAKGSSNAASFSFFKSVVKAWAALYAVSRPSAPTKDAMVLRVRTAMAKMTAAINSVLGRAKISTPLR